MLKFNPLQLTTICFKHINTNTIQDLQSKYDLFKKINNFSILIKWCWCDICLKNVTYCEKCEKVKYVQPKNKYLFLGKECELTNSIKLSELLVSEHNNFFEFKIEMYCYKENKYNLPYIIIFNGNCHCKTHYLDKNRLTHTTSLISMFLEYYVNNRKFELSIKLYK